MVLATATGWKLFAMLSAPGWVPLALIRGSATAPSLEVAGLNTLVYATVGALIGLLWPKRRLQLGHCSICDYDLTGNVSGVCPECGTPIPKKGAGGTETATLASTFP